LPEEQHEQELPPPLTGAVFPLESVEKQANFDNTRSDLCLQRGHSAFSFDWLIERRISNLESQSEHTYS
jgi:hypothetical protein